MVNILLDSEMYENWKQKSGLRPGSISTYKHGLALFGEFISDKGYNTADALDFSKFFRSKSTGKFYPITVEFIDEFVATLVSSETPPSSLRNTINALKSLFRHQYRKGFMERDILRHYPNRFYKPTLQDKSLTYHEAISLLSVARVLTSSLGEDYYLLILLLLTCGLRAKEVCCLREDQIEWEDHTILVNRGQKTKARPVVMSVDLENELTRLVQSERWAARKRDNPNPHVFHFEGEPLDYGHLRKMIETVVQSTDPSLSVTPHTLRYTMARILCDEGVNVSAIQWQMRHERLSTTLHYLGVDARAARQTIDENATRLFPRFPEMYQELKVLSRYFS